MPRYLSMGLAKMFLDQTENLQLLNIIATDYLYIEQKRMFTITKAFATENITTGQNALHKAVMANLKRKLTKRAVAHPFEAIGLVVTVAPDILHMGFGMSGLMTGMLALSSPEIWSTTWLLCVLASDR